MSRADKIRERKPILVTFPNEVEYVIYELTPIKVMKMWTKLGKQYKFDATDPKAILAAFTQHPAELMTPFLNAILHDPKLGKKADDDHITIEDITQPEFQYLLQMATGQSKEMVESFRPEYETFNR